MQAQVDAATAKLQIYEQYERSSRIKDRRKYHTTKRDARNNCNQQ